MEAKKKKSLRNKLTKKLKQKIYKWHRILAFVTIIPVIFWCLSGVMHPFMAHFFKPQITNTVLEKQPIDITAINVSLDTVLSQNKIDKIKNFRFVSFEEQQYYQVKANNDSILYFNTRNGSLLKNGDKLYANWLARYFLDDKKSKILAQGIITEFNSQYKYINRYLPVHKISFDRDDKMEIYVETASDKLATFNPKSRQFFIWFFDTFHNWSFIDAVSNSNIRICLMLFLLTIISLSALSGLAIYGFFWKQFKKVNATYEEDKSRKRHRKIGLFLAFFTLTFAFSGAYHSFKKWNPIAFEKMVYEPVFNVSTINFGILNKTLNKSAAQNVCLVQFNDTLFYRFEFLDNKTPIQYHNSITQEVKQNTDFEYATFLANYFNQKFSNSENACCEMSTSVEELKKAEKVKDVSLITNFKNHDYGFVNKRLPVVKVDFESENNKSLFVATDSGHLAAFVGDSERIEGYSFAFLHKFLFMEWAGKNIRDLTMVLAALGVLFVSVLGMLLLLKRK
jgi:hypothetical protein